MSAHVDIPESRKTPLCEQVRLQQLDRSDFQRSALPVSRPEVLDSEGHQEIVFKSTGSGASRPGAVETAWESDAARTDSAGHGASDAAGQPARRIRIEIDAERQPQFHTTISDFSALNLSQI